MLDPVALADRLGEMTDEGLCEVEVVFRLAADGCQIRLGDLLWLNIGGAVADRDHFVQFSNDTRVIPWLIAHAIRKHLAVGASLLDELEHLSDLIEEALARTDEIARLEELWRYDVSDFSDEKEGADEHDDGK
jgi:hypothetical protein